MWFQAGHSTTLSTLHISPPSTSITRQREWKCRKITSLQVTTGQSGGKAHRGEAAARQDVLILSLIPLYTKVEHESLKSKFFSQILISVDLIISVADSMLCIL
jgi:hypothetical protein